MGIFYAAPLLGPSLGPLLGGVLTQAFSWRAAFWLLAALLGVDLALFTFFFRDTFRRERSLTYRRALARRGRAMAPPSPSPRPDADAEFIKLSVATLSVDSIESKEKAGLGDGPSSPSSGCPATSDDMQAEITLSLADVNPFPPLLFVLRRRNNLATLIASGTTHFHPASPCPPALTRTPGLLFAFGCCIAYTCSRTLSEAYNYDALRTGLVLLSFGAGSMLGSVLGGRWSDRELRRLTRANGGHRSPEVQYPFLDTPPPHLSRRDTAFKLPSDIPHAPVDALRKHETRRVIPPTSMHRIRMARTETRTRRRPVHRALPIRLLLHVNQRNPLTPKPR